MYVGLHGTYRSRDWNIRNDLSHLYAAEQLPHELAKLPEWLADVTAADRKSFWYSMGYRIPESITLAATSTVISENGAMHFIKAEYSVRVQNGTTDKTEEESWVIYFMEENGVYSAFAVLAHENYEFVKSYSESIAKSYQIKQ